VAAWSSAVCRNISALTVQHAEARLHPTPYTPHPQTYTLHPIPYTLHSTPYNLHPTPYTLHPTPYTPHPNADDACIPHGSGLVLLFFCGRDTARGRQTRRLKPLGPPCPSNCFKTNVGLKDNFWFQKKNQRILRTKFSCQM